MPRGHNGNVSGTLGLRKRFGKFLSSWFQVSFPALPVRTSMHLFYPRSCMLCGCHEYVNTLGAWLGSLFFLLGPLDLFRSSVLQVKLYTIL